MQRERVQAIDSREVVQSHSQFNPILFRCDFSVGSGTHQFQKLWTQSVLKGEAASFVKNQTGTFNDMPLPKSRFGYVCSRKSCASGSRKKVEIKNLLKEGRCLKRQD